MTSSILPAVWFLLLGGLLTAYAVLDGINLGVGIVMPLIAKTEDQRGKLFTSIGPFWAGYEVYIVTSGGAMFAAFPRLYADSFSGFYLVLTLVLWLLIVRGGSIEFRNTVDNPLWRTFWDIGFSAASVLLALLYGAAAGNVVRGVALDSQGSFQGSFGQALNPYAVGVGLLAIALLGLHGTHYVAERADGELQAQARRGAKLLLPISVVLGLIVSGSSFLVRPDLGANFFHYPLLLVLPLGAIAGFALVFVAHRRESDNHALLASTITIICLLDSAGASLFPRLLPVLGGNGQNDLTIYNCAAPIHNLFTALLAYVIAAVAIIFYTAFVHRVFKGKTVVANGYH